MLCLQWKIEAWPCYGIAMRSDAEAKYRKVLQSKGKAKIARQRRSKARIGNGVVTRALLRQARAETSTDQHSKGNVKLCNA